MPQWDKMCAYGLVGARHATHVASSDIVRVVGQLEFNVECVESHGKASDGQEKDAPTLSAVIGARFHHSSQHEVTS